MLRSSLNAQKIASKNLQYLLRLVGQPHIALLSYHLSPLSLSLSLSLLFNSFDGAPHDSRASLANVTGRPVSGVHRCVNQSPTPSATHQIKRIFSSFPYNTHKLSIYPDTDNGFNLFPPDHKSQYQLEIVLQIINTNGRQGTQQPNKNMQEYGLHCCKTAGFPIYSVIRFFFSCPILVTIQL